MSYLLRSNTLRHAVKIWSRSARVGGNKLGGKFAALTSSQPAPRSFSVGQNLSDILGREHAEEIENALTTMPSELADLKGILEEDWRIVDNGAVTRLHGNVGAIKVQISFHCQDTVEAVDEGYVESGSEDADVDDDEAAVPIRFTVTASKAGKTLVMTCLSENAAARIQNCAMTWTQDVESIHASSGIAASEYQGPEFTELAEDLQNAFHEYLEQGVGVGEDVCSFISMYADYKEQSQYVTFLEDAKNMLD